MTNKKVKKSKGTSANLANSSLKYIAVTFIGIVLMLGLLGCLSSNVDEMRNPQVVDDESLDISAARLANNNINESYTFTLENDDWVNGSVVIYNSTGGNVFTAGTDYIVNYTAETITFKNTSTTVNYNNNITLVDYQYYSDNYVEDSSSRTLLSVLMIMVIIGIAMYALVPFIKSKVIKRFI